MAKMHRAIEICTMRNPSWETVEELENMLIDDLNVEGNLEDIQPDTQFDKGSTLQHLICRYAEPKDFEYAEEMLSLLFEYGAYRGASDSKGNAAHDIAEKLGKNQLRDKFQKTGPISGSFIMQALNMSPEEALGEKQGAQFRKDQKAAFAEMGIDRIQMPNDPLFAAMLRGFGPLPAGKSNESIKVDLSLYPETVVYDDEDK